MFGSIGRLNHRTRQKPVSRSLKFRGLRVTPGLRQVSRNELGGDFLGTTLKE